MRSASRVDAIERQEKLIKEEMEAEIKKSGGRSKKIDIANKYRIELKQVAGRVNWKDEFIKVEGPEAASTLQKNVKPGQRLTVTKL